MSCVVYTGYYIVFNLLAIWNVSKCCLFGRHHDTWCLCTCQIRRHSLEIKLSVTIIFYTMKVYHGLVEIKNSQFKTRMSCQFRLLETEKLERRMILHTHTHKHTHTHTQEKMKCANEEKTRQKDIHLYLTAHTYTRRMHTNKKNVYWWMTSYFV